MTYHVHQDGKEPGLFTLEELLRRRAAGEFNGTELAWRAGMTDWLPLDTVLAADAPSPASAGAFPAPGSNPGKKPGRLALRLLGAGAALLAALVVTVAILSQTARRQKFAPAVAEAKAGVEAAQHEGLEVARKPIVSTEKSLTKTTALRRDKEFRARQWLGGYELRNPRHASCDEAARHFLQVWLARNHGGPAVDDPLSTEELANRIVNQAGCDDPLVLAAAGVNSLELHEGIRRLERALEGFERSAHKAYPRFYTTVMLASKLGDQPGRVAVLDGSALRLLQDMLTDGGITPEDQDQLGEILLSGWANRFYGRQREEIRRCVKDKGSRFEWLALMLDGDSHLTQAWKARGGGYANTVTEEGWKGFTTELGTARKSLSRAWEMHPEWPLAPAWMVYVSLGNGGLEDMRVWFDRTTAAQVDYETAWHHLRWGLRPRWHGSLEAILAFGETAVKSGRFDSDAPLKLLDCIADLEAEAAAAPGEHLYGRPDIWPLVQQMYEGYLSETTLANNREGWHSAYGVLAYLARQYDVARQELSAIAWRPFPDNTTGWGVELALMPWEVAARTGESKQAVTDAEIARDRGYVIKAAQIYSNLVATAKPDIRTAEFLRHRLASLETERRLRAGEWVNFLPETTNAAGWVFMGNLNYQFAPGAFDVHSRADGHYIYSQARLGMEFEIKGEFEVLETSNGDFQAGLVFGLPDYHAGDWFAFRMKRNQVEGELASFSRAWAKPHIYQPLKLNDRVNAFRLSFQGGKVSASVNGREVFRGAKPARGIRVPNRTFLVGLGAFNDMNQTTIRYRDVQLRQLQPGQKTGE